MLLFYLHAVKTERWELLKCVYGGTRAAAGLGQRVGVDGVRRGISQTV